ncbi:MAG: thioredoxin-dependent thiol peroxidase [Spirochaetes bacterium]|nr:thioredoxin-dependent thiol peroxidase [Spirochaetota bacterium]
MLSVGDKAPDFTLKDGEGKDITLSSFLGKKVVLYFYPKDNTPGCTTEACGFRDVYDYILEKGAAVIGISRDSSASHKKFADKFNLPFYLLSDKDGAVLESYSALGEKKLYGKIFIGILRITYIIDENGIISKVFPKVSPKDHAKEVLDSL